MEPISLKPVPLVGRAALRLQSDERLARLCGDDVEPAFDEIVRRYWAPLVGFAGTIVGADKAEDVVQDSLMRARSALAGEERGIALKPWLYRIVRNAALNDLRDNRKHDHAELGDDLGSAEQPEEVAARRAELASTVAAISELPEAQRKALVGRELEGRSHAEIAADLNVSEGATKQLIHRARVGVRTAVGALIPLGMLKGLLGHVATAEAAATTGAVSGAGAGGLVGSLSGAGLAKVAAVAAIAGGTAVGGIEVAERAGSGEAERASQGPSAGSQGTQQAPSLSTDQQLEATGDVDEEADAAGATDEGSAETASGEAVAKPGNGVGSGRPGDSKPAGGSRPGKPAKAPGKPSTAPGKPAKAPGKPSTAPGKPAKAPGAKLAETKPGSGRGS